MIRKCILHIGLHKTGSSSIQQSLYSNLKEENFSYLDLKEPNHSSRLYSLFFEFPEKYHMNKIKGLNANQIQQLNNETLGLIDLSIQNNQSEFIIISAEDISVLSLPALNKLKTLLDKYFVEIFVVAYVRSPQTYFSSSFQEGVKAGWVKFDPTLYYQNYQTKLEKFDTVFGKDYVDVSEFSPNKLFEKDAVLDFCKKFNIEFNKDQVIRTNESLKKEALCLLYTYYKYGPGYGIGENVQTENNILINKLNNIGNTNVSFSPSVIEKIVNDNSKDIEWIEERMGHTFSDCDIQSKDFDIKSEECLLKIDDDTLNALFKLLDRPPIKVSNSFEVANLVHELRLNI